MCGPVGKRVWERSNHPSDVKRSKSEANNSIIGNAVWILATIYSIFLPLQLWTIWFYVGLPIFLIGLIIAIIGGIITLIVEIIIMYKNKVRLPNKLEPEFQLENSEELGIEKGYFKQPKRQLSIEIDCDKYNILSVDELDSLGVDVNEIDVNEDDIF